jgi:DNA-binding transcriptional regulator LsrR (DeoR family)
MISVREQVLMLARKGHPPREIADLMGMSKNTANWHLQDARAQGEVVPRFRRGGTTRAQVRPCLSPELSKALIAEARLRRVSPSELAVMVIEACVADNLFAAVLDAGDADHG